MSTIKTPCVWKFVSLTSLWCTEQLWKLVVKIDCWKLLTNDHSFYLIKMFLFVYFFANLVQNCITNWAEQRSSSLRKEDKHLAFFKSFCVSSDFQFCWDLFKREDWQLQVAIQSDCLQMLWLIFYSNFKLNLS